jgi:putative membrane protein
MQTTYRYTRAFILIGLGIYFFKKIGNGTIFYYINQRFVWLTLVGGLGFLLLGIAVFRKFEHGHHHHHDHNHNHGSSGLAKIITILIVSLPLLLGFIVPAQPLDSEVINNKGITYTAPLIAGNNQALSIDQPSDSRNILDWIRAFNYSEDPTEFRGQDASVVGFVYHDPRLPENQFMVGRIAVSCCVADAFAIGMVVEWPDAAVMADNSWVHVEGVVNGTYVDDGVLPLIKAEQVNQTDPPPQPYIYP